jgi:predicted GH43/DUF377 family glycosyl hydrolase
VIPTEHLQQKVELPGIVYRDYAVTGHSGSSVLLMDEKVPGTVKCWLNGSSIVHKGKRWLAYRIEMKKWFMWSRICLVELDKTWAPIPGTNKILPLHTRFDEWGAEDPRLFIFQDKIHMAYGDGFRMLLAELTDSGEVVKSKYVPADEEVSRFTSFAGREKNWGFFGIKDRLFAQQYCAPNIILEFDPESWVVINRWEQDWVWRSEYGAELHGGSSPVFHNGKLWRLCHTYKQVPRGSWIGWDGKLLEKSNAARYSVFMMEFEPDPPFYPVSISRKPILWTEFEKFDAVSPTAHAVVFVGSQERDGNGWRVTYGENDCRIVTQRIPDSDLEDHVPIKYREALDLVASTRNNHLHFFWLQGENNLPTIDKERIQKWRKKNPDWEIKIWDRNKLGTLVDQYPECTKTWGDLCTALDKFPNDKSIVAKVSDFARLLILYTQHSYSQEWNVYADTDTVPLRSLTSFLKDEYIYGQFWEKFSDPQLNPAEKPWNWDDVDFVVPQENRIDSRPFTVTNAILIGRPKAPVIMDLIKKGIDRRWQPTLKAWGPSMLQENLENSINTNKGWRTSILPYHYLVYNPKQHQEQRAPSWTLCHHLNDYRWETPGVKGTLTGKLDGPVKNAQIV